MEDKIYKINRSKKYYYFKKIGVYVLSFIGLAIFLAIPTSIIRSIDINENQVVEKETNLCEEKEDELTIN